MDIEKLLNTDSSRAVADMIAKAVDNNPVHFKSVFNYILKDQNPVSTRAARVLDICSEQNITLILPYLNEITIQLPHFKTEGVRRNLLKIISYSPIPNDDDILGLLVDMSFKWLVDIDQKPSIRVYCMEIIYRVSNNIPELKYELLATIEAQVEEGSAGIKSRGYKIIKILQRELRSSK